MNILFDNLEKLIDATNGIEKTRELILQLAVQGKLVEQDPNDEPASELLKKIKKEKEKLVVKGKVRNQNEISTIKDEEKPFNLPQGWAWCRISEIFTILDGNRIPINKSDREKRISNKNKKDLYPYYGATGQVGWIDDYIFNEKLILLGEDGAPFLEKSRPKSYIIEGKTWVNNHAHVLKLILGEENFYTYHLDTIDYTNLVQGMTRLKLNQSRMNLIVCPIPPLNEQKRIVEKVNSLMALLDELEEKRERRNQKRIKLNSAALEKLLTSRDDKELKTNWKRIEENFSILYSVPENVEKLKQAILHLAVQGKLVKQDPNDEPASELLKKIKKEKEKLIAEGKIRKQNELPPIKKEEIPFELPKGWEWVRLGNVGLINPRNDISDELSVSFVPMALISEKFNENVKSEIKIWGEIKKGFTHFANDDVGLAKITPCFENGKSAVFRNLMNGYGAGTTELHIFRKITNEISPDFIYILIKNPSFVDGGKSHMTGTAGQQRVSKDYFQNFVFALPPTNEQKRIVEKVNELMSLSNSLEEKLTKKEEEGERLVGAVVNRITNNGIIND